MKFSDNSVFRGSRACKSINAAISPDGEGKKPEITQSRRRSAGLREVQWQRVRMLALVTELSSPNLDGNHKELLISVSCRGATKRFDIQKDSRQQEHRKKSSSKSCEHDKALPH